MSRIFGINQNESINSPGSSINSLVKNDISNTKPIKKPKPILVATIGPGELFGDYEIFN